MDFLKDVAKSIFAQHKLADLQNVCIVLPTRRSVFFLKEYLSELSEIPFIAPEVFAIDDFVMRMSNLALIDNVNLLFKTYEIFKSFDESINFDRFIAWGPTLLKDFDVIDQYMVERPESIFEFMSRVEALKRWEVSIGSFEKLQQESRSRNKYFQLYENIYKVYLKLQEDLLHSGYAYRGLAYKHLASTINNDALINIYDKYYFAGFNAFSKAEEKILDALQNSHKIETYWDIDKYLVDKQYNHRGGKLIREYLKTKKFDKINWISDALLKDNKLVNIIGVENTSLQSKVAGTLYRPGKSTAIVLADENQLQALIYSLPEQVNDFNITMGLSLENASLYTLIEGLFELQQNIVEFANKSGEKVKFRKYNYRHVLKVLNHPLVRRYVELKTKEMSINPELVVPALVAKIYEKKAVFMSEENILAFMNEVWDKDIKFDLFSIIFKEWKGNTELAIKIFDGLIEEFKSTLHVSEDAVDLEFFYLFLTILNKFKKLIINKTINLRNLRYFLFELIKIEKIPFNGEPISELQIMGMLETRCLDFEKVIVLSMNEGILPVGNKSNSLIPFEASIANGLPVHTDKDAVMSYHFFRLLQRAKEIDLLYVIPSGEGSAIKEKSRFILQIENELSKLNKNIEINYPTVKLGYDENIQEVYHQEIQIPKTEELVLKLSSNLTSRGVSASSINTYLACSLKYYFNYILKLGSLDMENTLEANEFGTLLHQVLEEVDKQLPNQIINSEDDIEKMKSLSLELLEKLYEESLGGYVMNSGMNMLLKDVAVHLLSDFFYMQKLNKRFPLRVLGNEVSFNVDTMIKENSIKLKVSGKIDRIEDFNSEIIVVDYKTGKVEKGDLSFKEDSYIEDFLNPKKDKLRQLWLYQYLLWKTSELNPQLVPFMSSQKNIKSKIYSMRNFEDKLELAFTLPFQQNFTKKTEDILTMIVDEMLNIEVPFKQTSDINVCKFCDFKGICNISEKKIKKNRCIS